MDALNKMYEYDIMMNRLGHTSSSTLADDVKILIEKEK